MINNYFIHTYWFNSNFLFILFNLVYWGWILSEIINNGVSIKNSGGRKRDRGSYWIVVIGIFVSIAISFYLRSLNLGSFVSGFQYIGIAFMILGIYIREWAIFTLGKGFTVRVHVQKEGKLITHGPYKYIRNPSYTGSFLTFIGLPLAMGTWLGLIIILLINIVTFSYRINVEEKALIEAYGEDYESYMKRTWRLIPGIY
jgi:protein-S-isoprenylcysteine O-methyltransferase Ste14